MADTSLTSSLINLVATNNALANVFTSGSALAPLFSASTSFGNPLTLAAVAKTAQATTNQFPSQQVVALSGLFTQLSALNAAAVPLIQPSPAANPLLIQTKSPVLGSSAFSQTSASSSASSAVTASSNPGATITSYQVGVTQLGVAQANTGAAVTSATLNNAGGLGINTGTGTVQLSVNGGPTATANYFIYNTDTNEQALTAVANAINSISANHDVQTVTLSGTATAGSFSLTFNGQATAPIAVAGLNATTIRNALGALGSVGGNANVSVTQSGNTFTVAFVGALDNQALPQLQANNVSLNSGATVSTGLVAGPVASIVNTATTSSLAIAASAAGSGNAFTVSDAGGSNAIAASGAATVTTTAENAIYTVNGAVYQTTSGNTATLDNGNVTLSLLATTSSPATMTVSANTSALPAAVEGLTTAYNNLQSFLQANSQFLSPALGQQAQAIVSSHSADLAALGITSSTTLTVDQTTLAAASPQQLQAALSGSDGIATQLAALAQTAATSLEAPLAAALQVPTNDAEVATGLANLFPSVLIGDQLGSIFSIKA